MSQSPYSAPGIGRLRISSARGHYTVEEILKAVAIRCDIRVEQILRKKRSREMVFARAMAAFIMKWFAAPKITLVETGKALVRRGHKPYDHSTVSHLLQVFKDLMDTNYDWVVLLEQTIFDLEQDYLKKIQSPQNRDQWTNLTTHSGKTCSPCSFTFVSHR